MLGIRATFAVAALLVTTTLGAQGSGSVTPKKHVNPSRPSTVATRPASGAATAAAASPDVKVNEFMSYDSSARTVKLVLNSAHGSNNGGMNFNGGFSGNATITVPAGWSVSWHFTNEDAIPHSAIVLVNKQPFPAQPQDPAIPRAYTSDVGGGLATGKTDATTFKALPPGDYVIACGVPGHAPSGMWIKLTVSADAKVPSYVTK